MIANKLNWQKSRMEEECSENRTHTPVRQSQNTSSERINNGGMK